MGHSNTPLSLLKTLIETKLFLDNNSLFKSIVYQLQSEIGDKRILQEIENNNYGLASILMDNLLYRSSRYDRYYFFTDLESFPFKEKQGVNIDEIKSLLRVDTLQLKAVKDAFGNPASYCQHWEFDRRLSVRVDLELLKKIQKDRNLLLDLKKEVVKANQGYYYKFRVSEYVEPVEVNYGDDYDYDDSTRDYEEAAFYAMTEGELGDYDDFIDEGGSLDDIDNWARG